MSDLVIKQGAYQPYLTATLSDADGVINFNAKTVTFSLWNSTNGMVVNAAGTSGGLVITSSSAGGVRFEWSSTNLPSQAAGNYYGEFIWPSSSAPGKFPSNRHLEITVEPTATT